MKRLYSRRLFPRSMRVQDLGWVAKCMRSEYTHAGVTHHAKFGMDKINLRRINAVSEEQDNAPESVISPKVGHSLYVIGVCGGTYRVVVER